MRQRLEEGESKYSGGKKVDSIKKQKPPLLLKANKRCF